MLKNHLQVEVDTSSPEPILFISNAATADGLELQLDSSLFGPHEKVGILLTGVCGKVVPKASEGFNASEFEGWHVSCFPTTVRYLYLPSIPSMYHVYLCTYRT